MTLARLARLLFAAMLAVISAPALAVDTYRYFHVSIDTLWYLFIFLLIIVLLPFILMAVLYWWTLTSRKAEAQRKQEEDRSAPRSDHE